MYSEREKVGVSQSSTQSYTVSPSIIHELSQTSVLFVKKRSQTMQQERTIHV